LASIIHIQETDSTSNYLKKLLQEQQLVDSSIVFADYQTAGKGQRGNSWESEEGKNLLFSIVLYPDMVKANDQFIISQIISLAIAASLRKYTDTISIKWPNDIYWHDKKICGILIENTLLDNNIKESVCGIGININQTEFKSAAINPVSLKQITGKDYDLKKLLHEVELSISHFYKKLRKGDIENIIHSYKDTLFRRDGYHVYNDGVNDFSARIKDIGRDGTLILETIEGIERIFAFKEVKYIL